MIKEETDAEEFRERIQVEQGTVICAQLVVVWNFKQAVLKSKSYARYPFWE